MKVFLTGGTGFVGSHLAEHLISNYDAQVFALVRDLKKLKWLKDLDILPLKGDLFSIPDLPQDIDYVFHLAGVTKAHKSESYYTVNQKGTASLFHALEKQHIQPKKIVCLSSQAAAGPSFNQIPVTEERKPCPVSIYGMSKLKGEQEALKHKNSFPLSIIRVGPVYGPKDIDVLKYLKIVKKGIIPAFGFKKRLLNFCYIKDLIHALDLTAKTEMISGEIFHIANPQPLTWEDLGEKAGLIFGKNSIQIKIPLFLIYGVSVLSNLFSLITKKESIINLQKFNELKQDGWLMDTTKAQKRLSFKSEFPIETGLSETIKWYKEKEWI